ncbi:nitrate- and nitrite sensing domain-containing protein [Micromonospora sp. IBSANI012]|uniref:nitrate- and nitrite sensing domain-containing protein n=1 Tax=Micromonospora sp. IBSANI012 TaxID=3457761 RepID=UPI004058EA78
MSQTRTDDHGMRTRLVALAVVLITLWSYAAYLTGRDAADLLRVRALAQALGQPTDRLILELQVERRLTARTVADGGRAGSALAGARDGTDRAVAGLRASAADDLGLLTAGVRERADELIRQLGGLAGLRAVADAGRADAVAGYDRLIDTAFTVYGPEWSVRDSEPAAETRAIVALARARELLAREDTLLTAALSGGRIAADGRRRLAELVANQRYARGEAVAGLRAADRNRYQALVDGTRFTGLLSLEDALLRADDGQPVVTEEDWRATADAALTGLHEFVRATARDSAERATPDAALVVVRTGAVLGLGLITVLALLLTWTGTVRRLLGRRDSSALPAGPDLTEHATRELFLRLTQRNQVLLRDQLTLLDAMERRESSAEETGDLFQLDHLAARLRRNVEKLIILAGATPARRWRRPVPLLEVARGAMAEVADYQRVLVAPHWPWSLAAPAVTPVVHLLAELIENALRCSPADTTVRVAGEPEAGGCAIVVTDDGPGLSVTDLAEANELLADPPAAGPPVGRAGLHAAALLAARCGAQVSLRPGSRGGTAAVVLLPAGLVTPTAPQQATVGPHPAPMREPGENGDELPVPAHGGPQPPRLDVAEPTQMPATTAAEDDR